MIEYVFIDTRGKKEVGRGDGVARDIYSSFWIDVSNSLFIGEKERVPFVRQELREEFTNILCQNNWEISII